MTLVEAARMVSFGLVVLIWLVQLVIYPAFLEIAADRFVAYHAVYTRAVSWVVIPLMFGQAALLAGVLATRTGGIAAWAAAGLVVVAWAVTFLLAVPAHNRLQEVGLDPAVVRRLLHANGIRTGAWTLAWILMLLAR